MQSTHSKQRKSNNGKNKDTKPRTSYEWKHLQGKWVHHGLGKVEWKRNRKKSAEMREVTTMPEGWKDQPAWWS